MKKNFFKNYIGFDKILILTYFIIVFLLNISINFFNTGCLIYPETKLCFDNFSWSINKQEVSQMKVHYEWWSKSGVVQIIAMSLQKTSILKTLIGFQIGSRGIFLIKFQILYLEFYSCVQYLLCFFLVKKKGVLFINFFLIYLFLSFFLLEWFLKHPAMRYGGYILIAFPIILFSSTILSKFSNSFNKVKIISVFLIILILGIYNVRNFLRIAKEVSVYNYPFLINLTLK